MESSLYVSLSGQIALQRRMETIARNVANMNTTGYRADGVTFSEILSEKGQYDVSFASPGSDFISRQAGPITETGNTMDMAVKGDGWFALATPSGTVYTRDGRMHLNAAGELQSVNGYTYLDEAGQPLGLDPNGGPPSILSDGLLAQDGVQLGRIGLYDIPPTAKLSRYDNSAVIPSETPAPVVDFNNNGIVQGYLEGSNVNPVLEMTKLIAVTRAFESAASAARNGDSTLKDAIDILGATS